MLAFTRALALSVVLAGSLVGVLAPRSAAAQQGEPAAADSTPLALRATDISTRRTRPRIDGRLSDDAWSSAPVADHFAQVQPDPGAASSERTEARVLFDEEALYVGVRLHDSHPDSIVRPLSRRDDDVFSDWFYVALDGDRDLRTAYAFGVTPRGVQRDLLLFDDVREDVAWDAVWEVAVASDSTGWTAEFRIPFSQLRVGSGGRPGAEGVWGIDFHRRIARRDEIAHWSPVPARRRSLVSVFGELRGVRGISAPSPVELRPYTVARLTRAPGDPADPFYEPNELFASVGADLTYGPTPSVTLTATINPDFSQVEADPSLVNTTGYRSFLPEKRPFFLDDAPLFDVRVDRVRLFHSRRIGREPQRRPDVDAGYLELPGSSRILGAGKIVGESSDGWSIGVLAALTGDESARIADTLGVQRTEPVEPLTGSGVARVVKEFGAGNGTVGGILTAARRHVGRELSFLAREAYAGGVDARVRFAGGDYEVAVSLLGSHVAGSREAITRLQLAQGRYAQRPDAPHLGFDSTRTVLRGTAATASLARVGRGAWTWGVAGHAISPGFEVNDLGYQRTSDVASQSVFLGFDHIRADAFVRRVILEANQWSSWTFGRERTGLGANLEGRVVFRSFWGAIVGVERGLASLFPDGLRGGPALLTPATRRVWGTVYSDRRRSVDAQISATLVREDETGSRTVVVRPLVRGRPNNLVELSIEPSITWRVDAEDYIGQRELGGRRHYLFGEVDQTTASVTTRAVLTLSPSLALQFYAQPYLTARSFSEYKEAVNPRGDHFRDRFRTFGSDELAYDNEEDRYVVDLTDGSGALSFADPGYRFTEFRSNLVLRWDYRPGSSFILAWNRERTEYRRDPSYDLGRELSQITGLEDHHPIPTTDVLLLKLTYWIGR